MIELWVIAVGWRRLADHGCWMKNGFSESLVLYCLMLCNRLSASGGVEEWRSFWCLASISNSTTPLTGCRLCLPQIGDFYFLEKNTVTLFGYQFVGTTLWTGFDALGAEHVDNAMHEAMYSVADFMEICVFIRWNIVQPRTTTSCIYSRWQSALGRVFVCSRLLLNGRSTKRRSPFHLLGA